MKRSKPSTTRDPNDTGFLLVEWEYPRGEVRSERGKLHGVRAVEAKRFSSWQQAEDAAFDAVLNDGLEVVEMRWMRGRLP